MPKRKKSQRFKMMLIFATFLFSENLKDKVCYISKKFSFAVRQRCLKCDFVRIYNSNLVSFALGNVS